MPVVTVSVELSARRTVNSAGVPLKFATGTKRRLSAAATYNPLFVDTVPTLCQPVTSWYSQAPSVLALALLPTITTPAKLFALEPPVPDVTVSAVSTNSPLNRVLTVAPGAAVDTSSTTAANVTAVAFRCVGASLSAVTLVVNVTALLPLL